MRIAGLSIAAFLSIQLVGLAGETLGKNSALDLVLFVVEGIAGLVIVLATVLLPVTATVFAAGALAGATVVAVLQLRPGSAPSPTP